MIKKLFEFLIPLVLVLAFAGVSEYTYVYHQEWYRMFGWLVAVIIGILAYALLKSYEQTPYSSVHDALTGLSNRYMFYENLKQSVAYASRNSQILNVLYLDLDNLNSINENYGEEVGDRVIIEVAKRLKKTLRDSDIVARIDGDLFVALLADVKDERCLFDLVDKLTMQIHEGILIDEMMLSIEVSIGTSTYPEHGLTAQELIDHADREMQKVKKAKGYK